MEKEQIKDKILNAIWLLNQRGKGNKDKAKDELWNVYINIDANESEVQNG